MKKGWGFDTRDIDKTIRPQDDFYLYANGSWLKRSVIPPAEASWGSFIMLRYDTEKKLRNLVTKVQKMKHVKRGGPEQAVRDFYISGLDMKKRNTLGLKPLTPWLGRIKKIKDARSLVSTLAHLEKIGGGGPFGLMIDQDMKNSGRYIIHICQGGLGMPDRDYYLKNHAESPPLPPSY